MQKTLSPIDNYEKFDCKLFQNSFKHDSNAPGGYIPNFTRQQFQREAYHTWSNFYFPHNSKEYTSYINGTLSCFCDEQYQLSGFFSAFQSFREDGADMLLDDVKDKLFAKELEDDTETPSEKIC